MADTRHRGVVVDLVGEVLLRRGSVCFTVSSSSMEPTLRVGDRVEARRSEGDPALGDVVVFRDPTLGCVVHRVVWRWPLWGAARRVYTKGDRIPYRDPGISPEQLLGRVERIERRGITLDAGRRRLWRLAGSALDMMIHRLARGKGSERHREPDRLEIVDDQEDVTPSRTAGAVDSPNPRS